jgi:hypothetical protein
MRYQIIYPNTQSGPVGVKDSTLSNTRSVFGSFSQAAVAVTTFTVPITSQIFSSYSVSITPTSFTATVSCYVTNKTLSSFDVTFIVPVTGLVEFDWIIVQ